MSRSYTSPLSTFVACSGTALASKCTTNEHKVFRSRQLRRVIMLNMRMYVIDELGRKRFLAGVKGIFPACIWSKEDY